MNKTALVTGITGQDGAYLAELLLEKNYKVYGTFRRNSSINMWRINELNILNNKNFKLIEIELTDLGNIINIINEVKPDEIYNLAAQSFVASSFKIPIGTSYITGIGCLNILEAIRNTNKDIRFYQASTSEMFGKVQKIPQDEKTNFYPRSPYGVSKLFSHWMTINYRETYNIFATSGILFNHESPLRGIEFATRKITDSVAKIKLGKIESFELGNLNSKRDWGYAKEYVEGMWKMLQTEKPETYVLATNETNSVRNFLKYSFEAVDIEVEFYGEAENEICVDKKNGKKYVSVNPLYYRPAEVDLLVGDYSKAKKDLNWSPNTKLSELIKLMVDADLKRNKI
jgi:GDPmannose 4,6-dehydratase